MITEIRSLLYKNKTQMGSLGYEFYLHSKRRAHRQRLKVGGKSWPFVRHFKLSKFSPDFDSRFTEFSLTDSYWKFSFP